ncbi:Alpha/Beta hydrolase protein [Podospora didyma]|uniref:Alpha/Beta hydrolase protein n=1 Tax=Podospora didyma TaxID=330526 RepID=A0AAE0P6D0_9PEZI|nr:Alpha/Beta hydrolase protein [Podospora didyma]
MGAQERNPTPPLKAAIPHAKASAGHPTAIEFAKQAEKLSHQHPRDSGDHVAVEARFVTKHDPVIVMSDGTRLPPVPLKEAQKLNILREEALGSAEPATISVKASRRNSQDNSGLIGEDVDEKIITLPVDLQNGRSSRKSEDGSLRRSLPPSHTNPLFPPLPLYGPPSILRNLQCLIFRFSSFFLSMAFLGVIVLGALFTSIPPFLQRLWQNITFRDPDRTRPFYEEELRRKELRSQAERRWKRRKSSSQRTPDDEEGSDSDNDGFVPTEGGPDPIVCDVGYYARRVGLDVDKFEVQTEDGFIIDLWHVYDPKDHTSVHELDRAHRGPEVFGPPRKERPTRTVTDQKPKFPVLLMHGLLQSSGAYCVNDEDSLAFYLCKSGYDVWLGNNRCGFKPKHVLLDYSDPRMWCWNIRQMGVFDLPALTSRVLYETGFEKLGLICHSQGTTQTFVALAKEQRPDLGEKLTVFCALAPAAYAGPLIGKMYFKFMRVITPAMFRLMFGLHAFIPIMMTMHSLLDPRIYGWMGYKVFSFLFNWTDSRWDRALKDRMFQFAPVYVSSESMRWWLGRECFAKHRCILATKEEWRAEEREDREHDDGHDDGHDEKKAHDSILLAADRDMEERNINDDQAKPPSLSHGRRPKGSTAWYNHQAPPFALWIAGNDALVDGGKLLRRFERGREPHVRLVHRKVIEEYEHLDVIWAMDAVDQVFKEVREVLWKTCDVRDICRIPRGCKNVPPLEKEDKRKEEEDEETDGGLQSSSSEELSA